jgi:hypothetical protein
MINQSKQYFHSLIHINTKIQNNARKIKKKTSNTKIQNNARKIKKKSLNIEKKNELAGYMDFTLEFLHSYTFSKVASYMYLLHFSFPSFFPLHFLFFSKLARTSI